MSERRTPSKCHLCERETRDFPRCDRRRAPWACRPCVAGYVAFRRAFKAEHGRYPTVAEFRAEELE